MKVKKRNLIEIILQGLCLILLFIPYFFRGYDAVGSRIHFIDADGLATVGIKSPGIIDGWSVLDLLCGYGRGISVYDSFRNNFFAIAMFVFCIGGLVLFIIQFISKGEKRNNKIVLIPPVLQAIALMIFIPLAGHWASEFSGYRYNQFAGTYEKEFLVPGVFFYVYLVLLIALLVISIVGYILTQKRGIIEEDVKMQQTTNIVSEISGADEIRKYKELLDQGIITKEEFEVKKKKLLS